MFFRWEVQVFKNIKSVSVFKLLGYCFLVTVFVVYFLSFPVFVSSSIFFFFLVGGRLVLSIQNIKQNSLGPTSLYFLFYF